MCAPVLGQDAVELVGITLSPQDALFAVGFGVALDLARLAACLRDQVGLVPAGLVDELLFFLAGPHDVVESFLDRVRSIHALQLDFGDAEPTLVVIHEPLQPRPGLILHALTSCRESVVDGRLADYAAQRHLGRRPKRVLRVGQPEEILARIGDAVLRNQLCLDDVLVAGEHLRLVGHPLAAAKPDLDTPNLLDVHERVLLHPGDPEVQARSLLRCLATQCLHDGLLARTHGVEREVQDDAEQHEREDRPQLAKVLSEPPRYLIHYLGNLGTLAVVVELASHQASLPSTD